MPHIESYDFSLYQDRRNKLIENIKREYGEKQSGIVVLFANFEQERSVFRQESSFYYFTGINEPACVLTINLQDGNAILYVPDYGNQREKWMANVVTKGRGLEEKFGINAIEYLGNPCVGYQCHPFFTQHEYAHLLTIFQKTIKDQQHIFTLNPENMHAYIEQRFTVQRINALLPGFENSIIDISSIAAKMRRIKSMHEIELLYKAIDITISAHYAGAQEIKKGIIEYELQAMIEYMFTMRGGERAFPSIVATGHNGTVLHYHSNNAILSQQDLVVVDIGAEYNHYCADLTRTYPVSGKFSSRQQEIYMTVLETQEYIAQNAKPGYWLSCKEYPEKSLHHLAVKFLAEKGYDKYFMHGIGHFLGLDVHDVGNYQEPLQPGDVITIEPGIYISEESLGVRIEDNYWIVDDGAVCLSEELPKYPEDIEEMMREQQEGMENYDA